MSGRQEYDDLITLLLSNEDYVVQEHVPEYDDQVEREPETVDGKKQRVQVAGNLISMLENLDNEVSLIIGPTSNQANNSLRKLCNIPTRTRRESSTSSVCERRHRCTPPS